MDKPDSSSLQLILLLLSSLLVVTSGLYSGELDDGPYKRALRQAAAMSDGWGGQSILLHRLTKDLDPDVIPERTKRSITVDPAVKFQELEYFEKGVFFNDYNLGVEDDNFTSYFANLPKEADPEVLTCVGDGSNSTIEGYCKDESLCESFGGTAVGLCWKDSDVVSVCCQPTPGRFFPIPYLYEPEVDMKRLRRTPDVHPPPPPPPQTPRPPPNNPNPPPRPPNPPGGGNTGANTGAATPSMTTTSMAMGQATTQIKDMNQKLQRRGKGKYYRADYEACAQQFHKRMATSESSLEISYALLTVYASARNMMKKYRYSAAEALALITNSKEGYEVLQKYCTPIPKCDLHHPYHSIDGICNNENYPLAGRAGGPMVRLVPGNYADGLWEIPYGYQGHQLPLPRQLTVELYHDEGPHETHWSMLLMMWGQYITHDMIRGPELRQYPGGEPIFCCEPDMSKALAREKLHMGCLPLHVAPTDRFYKEFKVGCLTFARSLVTLDSECRYTIAQHLNAPTSHLDCSHVYGNDPKTADAIRTFQGGSLISKCCNGNKCSKDTNPPEKPNCDVKHQLLPTINSTCDHEGCEFLAGDRRVNENPALVMLHTMSMRWHNYCAQKMAHYNPHWDDNKIYYECRRIAIARYQYITFHQYLPVLFGKKVLQKYSKALDPDRRGYTYDYNPKVLPGVLYEFGPGAFRMGHSQCFEDIWYVDKLDYRSHNETFKTVQRSEVVEEWNLCSYCCSCNKMKQVLLGLIKQEVYKVDEYVEVSMVGQLFKGKGAKFGHDMASMDWYRYREAGGNYYRKYLEYCQIGGKRIQSWDDLLPLIPAEKLAKLRKLYRDWRYLELMPVGFLEKHRKEDFMGPTFVCLLLEAFLRIKITDRFWFSEKNQPQPFTPAQLNAIYTNGGLSNTICTVFADVDHLVPNPFLTPVKSFNPILSCKHPKLQPIDLSLWKEPEPQKVSGGVCKFYQNGKPYYGTCLPKELVERPNDRQAQYKGAVDSCGSSKLLCGKGVKAILSAHIGYSEPTADQLDKFRKLTPAVVAHANKRVETDPYGLRWYTKELDKIFTNEPASEKYILTETMFATHEEQDIAIDSIKLQHAWRLVAGHYANDKYMKASSLVGVVWKDIQNKACLKERICQWDHPYRVPDGHCNYKANPLSGVADHTEATVIPAVSFSDGISKYPVAAYNKELPNPRQISLRAFKRESRPDNDVTLLTAYAVDFLRLSTVHQPIVFKGMSPLECCDGYGNLVLDPYHKTSPKPGCSPILIGKDDPFFAKEKISCLPVLKCPPGAVMKCSVQPNTPFNRGTGFLVPELVYGSSVEAENRVRVWEDGLLRLDTKPGDKLPVLPQSKRLEKLYGDTCHTTRSCKKVASSTLNGHAHLQPLAVVWAREHNRLAKLLKRLYPKWSDHQLFQEAKAITIAQFQVITLKEIVPALIGDYNVKTLKIGLNDIIYNAEAYSRTDRFGPGSLIGGITLTAIFLNMVKPIATEPESKYNTYADPGEGSNYAAEGQSGPVYGLTKDMAANSKTVDLYFEKLIKQYAEKYDNNVFKESASVFKFKHQGYTAKIGTDSLATLIQGSRIFGFAFYNDLRQACGFAPAHKFEDFADTIKNWQGLKTVYASPKDVDGLVGLMLESPYPYNSYGSNSKLGGVGVCLLTKLVADWVTKDRYFVGRKDNPRLFTGKQIQAIMKRTMAGVLCDNTEYVSIRDGYYQEFPKNVFLWPSASNPLVSCKHQPSLDLGGWTGPPEARARDYVTPLQKYRNGGSQQKYSERPAQNYPKDPVLQARHDVDDDQWHDWDYHWWGKRSVDSKDGDKQDDTEETEKTNLDNDSSTSSPEKEAKTEAN